MFAHALAARGAGRVLLTGWSRHVDRCVAALAMVAAVLWSGYLPVDPLSRWFSSAVLEEAAEPARSPERARQRSDEAAASPYSPRETVVSFYAGAPWYYRSNVHLTRSDGTDIDLKALGWDGDALYFPIDGGIRSIHWAGPFGFMVDFLHNKAIARLGKGAHGRKLKDGVIETVDAAGSLKGQPAPPRLKLTDLFDRLEFTHGHNVLLFNGMARLGALGPRIRPYVGIGGGIAVPHVEVWFAGENRANRTNEYQYAGPAAQALLGLELRVGRVSYYLEYKFTYAWLSGALTGDSSWLNFNMPGDMWRQFSRWWTGTEPQYGRFSTQLGAHQIVAGAGYAWPRATPTPAP
jgi:hypothetical protein